MKRILILAMALLMLAGVSACGGDTVNNVVNSVTSRLAGDVTGETGVSYETEWFTFQVNSVETVTNYAGVDADEGCVFLIANVYEKNTWDGNDSIPMSCYDYYALEGENAEEIWPEEPWDNAMMPNEFYLAPEEEATYDVVFQVSSDVAEVSFVYVEVDADGGTHATFTIEHAL